MSMDPAQQAEIRILPGNDRCVDCGANHPQWASVTFGALMCLECSGAHRGMGVHISFVRSVTMDSWNKKQLDMMTKGGNADLIAFWKKHGVDPRMPHNAKYHEPASMLYADRLKAKVEGRPLPTELPKRVAAPTSCYDAPAGGAMSAGGFNGGDAKGSEALKGETTEQYVARQRRLQAEARERMRAKFGSSGMGGVGSNSNYNPATGSYGSGGGLDADRLRAGAGAALGSVGSALSGLGGAISDGAGRLQEAVGDDEAAARLRAKTAETTAAAWGGLKRWGSVLTDKVKDLTVADPDPSDLAGALRNNGLRQGSGMSGVGSQSSFGGGGGFGSQQSMGGFGSRDSFGGGGGMAGFGSQQSFASQQSSGGGYEGGSDTNPPSRASSRNSFASSNEPARTTSPVPPAPARSQSAPVPPAAPLERARSTPGKAKKLAIDEDDDFFGNFGV